MNHSNLTAEAHPAQGLLDAHLAAQRLAADDKARAFLHAVHEAGEQPFTATQVQFLQTVGHTGAMERLSGASPLVFVAEVLEVNLHDFTPVQMQWARHFASEEACGTDNSSLFALLASQD